MHNNVPEGPPYPIRTAIDGNYRYIRNLLPEEIYIEKHLTGGGRLNNPYWTTWVDSDPKHTKTYDLVKRYMRRPAEQLYHTTNDTNEMTNILGVAEHTEAHARLSMELDRWMAEQGDPGTPIDTLQALQASSIRIALR